MPGCPGAENDLEKILRKRLGMVLLYTRVACVTHRTKQERSALSRISRLAGLRVAVTTGITVLALGAVAWHVHDAVRIAPARSVLAMPASTASLGSIWMP
jgi:hypothetical protein